MTHKLIQSRSLPLLLLIFGLWQTSVAATEPGEGVTVVPVQSTVAEETFQTMLVMKALEKLGYTVEPIKEIEYAAGHVAIAKQIIQPETPVLGLDQLPIEALSCHGHGAVHRTGEIFGRLGQGARFGMQ